MTRRTIGLIGLGMAVAPHAQSLEDLQGRVEVRAWSPSAERRRAFEERYDLPVVDELEAIADDPAVTAVMILTPPDARLELVGQLAGKGKHLLMEKPLERTLEAAERVVALTEAAGVTTGVVLQHRFREAATELARRLADGELGTLATVQLSVPWWRPQSYYDVPGRGTLARDGGGVLITQAIHSLDLMLSLTGPAAAVQAMGGTSAMHRMEGEDFMGGGIAFANGALGAVMATTTFHPGRAEQLVLAGTKGVAVLDGGRLTLDFLDGRSETTGEAGGIGGGADPMAFSHEWHKAVITDFLDALDQGSAPRVTARDALHVHRLIDALLRSAEEGRRIEIAAL
ncbi:MAG: Gfo/Idh/MocA family oxidoreductase [Geminicoccaceae bacterium]|jgi:predicted dehydrogenase|nr:Gfo/Idh/MocA family oxidoreductase [Geminicoccaceae bacterium]HRY23409.1 Gfo/Idh/MocA family oxidoreductase [Geminicoccaceae bacterium]